MLPKQRILDFAFRRYFNSAALFGTEASCQSQLAALEHAGVDEIACLIDFGLERRIVMAGLEGLARLASSAGPLSVRAKVSR